MLVSFLVWQARVRRAVTSETPEGRRYVEQLVQAADVLGWDDPEIRARVQLSADAPDRYFDAYGDSFTTVSEVWPFAVLCAELERAALAVRASAYDAPTRELCRRFDPILARCGPASF